MMDGIIIMQSSATNIPFFSNFFHWAYLPWDAFLHISVKNKCFFGRAIIVADINIISMESVPKARFCCLQSQIK